MLSKHLLFCCVCFHIFGTFGCFICANIIEKSPTKLGILKNVLKLTDTLLEVTPYINITISGIPPNCVQMACKFVCFNGKSSEIDHDIDIVANKNNITCNRIEELRLYSYEFPGNKLYYGFLGSYSDRVETLYVASSNITDVASGTFANGVFQQIYFENLKLMELKKDFFEGITSEFQALSVIQKEDPLRVVNGDFLDHVKYQIKALSMQVGLTCVRNLTGSENLLNNLVYVDFSYNDFGQHLTDSVFSKLSMVEQLDLSHSNLEYLPEYIFSYFTSTLEYLDLSYNKLKTITRTIFGWHDIPRDLKIYANDNEWECSCWLQEELKEIFIYQTTKLVCATPTSSLNWSVFDDRLCEPPHFIGVGTTGSHMTGYSTSTPEANEESFLRPSTTKATTTMTTTMTTTTEINKVPVGTTRPDLVELKCLADSQREDYAKQPLKWPLTNFSLHPRDQLRVEVIVESLENSNDGSSSSSSSSSSAEALNDTFGLIWFSKATTQYYKMEINYNEYGLGCYNSISDVNTVSELIPNVAYTFCLVLKDQLTISPFNCKSIHVGSNLSIQYSAWLTRDMKVTGLSLVIFGIVMFSFAGILLIYLLLKRKPILLKGSKRVTMTSSHSGDIVVMPRAKSVKSIKEKESKLAQKGPMVCSERRRKSNESVASYQSYMNANVYEVIPAYSQITTKGNDSTHTSSTSTLTSQLDQQREVVVSPPPLDSLDVDCCYLTPLHTVSSSADLMNYAEIPYRSKRVSNDPLPEIPTDQDPFYGSSIDSSAYPDVGVIYMLDSQV